MRARVIIAVALAALGITACIIGPKQDDPNALAGTDPPVDANSAADTDERSGDTSPASAVEAGPPATDAARDGDAKSDASDASDARADGDAATDAAEGG